MDVLGRMQSPRLGATVVCRIESYWISADNASTTNGGWISRNENLGRTGMKPMTSCMTDFQPAKIAARYGCQDQCLHLSRLVNVVGWRRRCILIKAWMFFGVLPVVHKSPRT